jgi:membrane complex biogenesis BtpA family protein
MPHLSPEAAAAAVAASITPWRRTAGPVVVGMVHLQPLPGSPRFAGDAGAILDAARRDALALAEGGVHAVMVENFGDVPFFPGAVPSEVIAQMSVIVSRLRDALGAATPLGVNVLRNDGVGALAVAHAAGASFIRVNVLCGARVTDQGVIQGIAHDLLRKRVALGATGIRIFADVDVKHSQPLAGRESSLEDEVADTLHRGLADALIVSGTGTGRGTDPDHVRRAKQAAGGAAPVFVGSGVSLQTIDALLRHADGFIVGTALKRGGRVEEPVEVSRVKELIARVG